MTHRWIRGAAAICALGLTGAAVTGHASAAPTPNPDDTAATCEATTPLSLINFNDFHGRIAAERPDTVGFFGEIEKLRADAGEDNSLVLSAGDNIGGALFPSFALEDNPTIDVLNAAEIDASAVGNHEFDRGYDDLKKRIEGADGFSKPEFPYLGANVTVDGNVTKPYATFERSGVTVAVIGAVTADLPSLVSPAGLEGVTISDPVEAVNKYAAELSDGNPDNGEADVIVAEYHEGGSKSEGELADNTAATEVFDSIVNKTSGEVDAIFTAHTHQTYAYDAPVPDSDKTRPVVQSAYYAELIGHVTLDVAADGTVCGHTAQQVTPEMSAADAAEAYPRAAEIQEIVNRTLDEASVIGREVVGKSEAPITRATSPDGEEDRGAESTLSNLVAQQFKEVLGKDDPNFIGVQNPGGTRADLDEGDITYEEAAGVLPFANSLKTTQLSGAQVKTLLEQQWQRDENGEVPGRPFLALGFSDNLSYTYDESRDEGDRITGIWVNGEPIDPDGTYTLGSGNFLIDGGDNFHVLAEGANTADTGRVDLEAWTEWLTSQELLKPDHTRRGVSVTGAPESLVTGEKGTVSLGVPAEGGVAGDTLTTDSADVPAPTKVTAKIGETVIGEAEVVDAMVTDMELTVPEGVEPGLHVVEFTIDPTGTVVRLPIRVDAASGEEPGDKPGDEAPGDKPGDTPIDPAVVTHFSYDGSCNPSDGSRQYTPGETYTFVVCNGYNEPVADTEIKIYETADNNADNLQNGTLVETVRTNEKGEFSITIPNSGYVGAISSVTPEVRVLIGQDPSAGEDAPGEVDGDSAPEADEPAGGLPKTGR